MILNYSKRYFLSIFLVFFCYQTTKAQDFRYNLYNYNAFGVNPALAGMQKEASVSFHSRKQAVASGLSHKTIMLSALYPIMNNGEHYGTIGINVYRDRQNYFGKVQAFDLLAAFNVPVYKAKQISLALGIQGGSREKEDNLLGTNYVLGWSGGTMVYQNYQDNSYRQRWFIGVSGSNWLKNERYLENYLFSEKPRTTLIAGFEAWKNKKYALIPNVRSIIQNGVDFTNYGISLRRFFSDNSGTLFRYGSWGVSGWYAHNQAYTLALDMNSPTFTMGFSYSFASQNHLFKYKNANEFIVTLKKPIGKIKIDDKPIINDSEQSIP
ncbi:hypothetical protein AD998_10270 [bacterium 336/3]|nr:hypothetical protein AD998_10270 [bacterium 336/3]